MYQIPASEIPIGRVHYSQLLDLTDDEIITTIISTEKRMLINICFLSQRMV